MSTWNDFTSDERIGRWTNLRSEITSLEQDQQLTAIAEFFSSVPISSRTIDFYTPETWPTPWETLYHNELCQSSVSLIMYHTLMLLDKECDVEIILINDGTDRYLLPIINNQYILNYEFGQISN